MMKEIWIFPVQCIVAFHVILRIKERFFPPKNIKPLALHWRRSVLSVQFELIF